MSWACSPGLEAEQGSWKVGRLGLFAELGARLAQLDDA